MPAITVSGLSQAAIKFQSDIRTLPYAVLMDVLTKLKINQLQVANKDTIKQFERKRGLAKPYSPLAEINYSDLGKFSEMTLEVKKSYASIKDHIENYKEKIVLNDINSTKVDNKQKKHPLEVMIIMNQVRTFSEDIVDALFFSERNESDLTPMGCFDGYNTIIDAFIASGAIAAGNKNLKVTGNIAAPVDGNDTDAWDILVDFLRSAHPSFRSQPAILYTTDDVVLAAKDALDNKLKYKSNNDVDFLSYLQSKTMVRNLQILNDPALGSGDRMILTVPGNLDFGMNTKGDEDFVQVRAPYEDPNLIQFWLQADFGARVNSLHEKLFLINDQTSTSLPLSGDYIS